MTLYFDTLFINANLATMDPSIDAPYGAIENGALGVKDGRITWIGKGDELSKYEAAHVYDCGGEWMTPGLVDCHTHLVFGGDRAAEFEQRLQGASYEDIAKAGGGIVSTVNQTRMMSGDELYLDASVRLKNFTEEGVTTIEIKSGYGLDTACELRILEVAEMLGAGNVHVQRTYLGAHALPQEYEGCADEYIDLVCNIMIPQISNLGLADAVDGFCENIGFSSAQIRRVFEAAKMHDLPVKLHAEQLSGQGGAALAAEFGALSADHLEYLSEDGVKAMAKAGTVAVLLPGAFYYLKETQKPPIDLLRKYGVPMAIASDCNPGSSPITSPLLILNMACILFGLTPEEAFAGMTREGAKALGMDLQVGTLEIGKCADMAIWNINHMAELCYWAGHNFYPKRVFEGQIL